MRGILWTLVSVILILAFLTFLIPTLFGAVGNAVQVNAVINAEQMAGIINILESSPANGQYKFFLPDADCKVQLKTKNGIAVLNFSITLGTEQQHLVEIIENGVSVSLLPQSGQEGIECDKGREKPLYFARLNNNIFISENSLISGE